MGKNTVRVNLNIPENVKQWYMEYAKTMGTNMSNYMVYTLCSHYNTMQSNKTLSTIAELGKNEEYLKVNKEMLDMFKAIMDSEKK